MPEKTHRTGAEMKKADCSACLLLELGFYPQLTGFAFLAYAIGAVAEDPARFYTRKVRPIALVAESLGLDPENVRRDMLYALRTAWETRGNTALRRLCPKNGEGYPPQLYEFIFRLALELNRRLSSPDQGEASEDRAASSRI